MRKDLGYSLARLTELLTYLLIKNWTSYSEIQNGFKTDFRVAQKYVKALEEVGWVEIIPIERRNLMRLTDRGCCVARCLVS